MPPELRIDRDERRTFVDGREISLTAAEFDLLAFFSDHPGRAFTRGELIESVWRSSADQQTAMQVAESIHRLRRKVGGQRITAMRGYGYRFEADPIAEQACAP